MRGPLLALCLIAAASATQVPAPITADTSEARPPPIRRKRTKVKEHPLTRPLCGAAASCTAEALTMPIDCVKVRMMLATDSSRGFLGTLSGIRREEGSSALFKGLKPALIRQASYQGIKMCLYEPIRDAVLKATTPEEEYEGRDPPEPKLYQMIVAGGLAGAIGTFLTSPTDLVKIRMQSGVAYDGVRHAFASVFAEGGVGGLWDGWLPNCQRSFIVNAAELATYDFFKLRILRCGLFGDGLAVHTLASSLAGLVAAIASTPVDRAKTLLMTSREQYGGKLLVCLLEIYHSKGLSGLYQGFLATWMRLGPWAFLFFVCFEQFRIGMRVLSGSTREVAVLEEEAAKEAEAKEA